MNFRIKIDDYEIKHDSLMISHAICLPSLGRDSLSDDRRASTR
ncbi:hypothetical protein [Algoriphagus sp. Y33]|nr:hypothetical protein [Algoriphagus sp. Y33]